MPPISRTSAGVMAGMAGVGTCLLFLFDEGGARADDDGDGARGVIMSSDHPAPKARSSPSSDDLRGAGRFLAALNIGVLCRSSSVEESPSHEESSMLMTAWDLAVPPPEGFPADIFLGPGSDMSSLSSSHESGGPSRFLTDIEVDLPKLTRDLTGFFLSPRFGPSLGFTAGMSNSRSRLLSSSLPSESSKSTISF